MYKLEKTKQIFSAGLIPLLWAILFAIFTVIYKTFDLPPPEEMAIIGRELYEQYGIVVLLIAAFVEGIFMVNIYFPGSFVIVLAVFLSDKSFMSLAVIGGSVWFGFVLAGAINYLLGKYGFYKLLLLIGRKDTVTRMQKWVDKRGNVAIFIAAIHTNFLAIAQVCLGIAKESLRKNLLLSGLSLAFWIPIWTFLFSIIIEKVNLEDSNQAWYIVATLFLWAIILIMKEQIAKRLKKNIP